MHTCSFAMRLQLLSRERCNATSTNVLPSACMHAALCGVKRCNATCVLAMQLAYLRTGVGGGIVEDGGKGVGGVERGRPFHGSGYDFAVCGCTCNAAHVLSRNMVHRGGSAQTATRALFCSTDVLWTTSAPHGTLTHSQKVCLHGLDEEDEDPPQPVLP